MPKSRKRSSARRSPRAKTRRAKPGARGHGGFFHIQVRPRTEFVFFRNQDVGRRGGIERVAGRRANGSWDTQKWLIGKSEAHRDGQEARAGHRGRAQGAQAARLGAAPSRRRPLHRQAAPQDPGKRKADAGHAPRPTRQHQEGAGCVAQAAAETRMIRKLPSGKYRLYSRKKNPRTGKRRNLGTFSSRKAAEQHERAVQYFKRH